MIRRGVLFLLPRVVVRVLLVVCWWLVLLLVLLVRRCLMVVVSLGVVGLLRVRLVLRGVLLLLPGECCVRLRFLVGV